MRYNDLSDKQKVALLEIMLNISMKFPNLIQGSNHETAVIYKWFFVLKEPIPPYERKAIKWLNHLLEGVV